MKAQFTIQSGSRAGQIDLLGQTFISVGRHPECHLRFDPEADLDVSSRHATITFESGYFVLRDLDSTNGTFVNGGRLNGEHLLADDDLLQFGANGPKAQFKIVRGATPPSPAPPVAGTAIYRPSTDASLPAAELAASPGPLPPRPPAGGSPPRGPRVTSGNRGPAEAAAIRSRGSTTVRVKAEVARQTKSLRNSLIGLGVLIVILASAAIWQRIASGRALEAQRQVLLGQVDSLMNEVAQMAAGAQSLREALDSTQATAVRLKAELDAGHHDPAALDSLRQQLNVALRHQRNLSSAAALDARTIAAANTDATALIFVQFQDGRTFTGSAFAVRTDAGGGLLLTNRHVVVDSAGNPPLKIGVAFNGSSQNFRAELVKSSPTADVALIRVLVAKGIPTVARLAAADATIQVGEPVAMIGFPLGLDLPMGGVWTSSGVRATLTLGTAAKVLPTLLQIDGYGAEGSSGSPVFNRAGEVVALVYGGQRGTNGRVLYSVPIRYGLELLH
jgi:S1-C subfamily serine protease